MEPWLSGTKPHPDPIVSAVFHSFQQVREDLAKWTAGLTDHQTWQSIEGLAPLGFQLRHIAGSVDRLVAYAKGEQLNDEQIRALKNETQPGASLRELLADLHTSLEAAERSITGFTDFAAPREVGRKKLPTTLGGLLVHIAEHPQRHLGQAIVTCKLLTR
jgi:uncharacterized damage-inducible protein DinB